MAETDKRMTMLESSALAALEGFNHFGGIRRGGPLGFETWCDDCPRSIGPFQVHGKIRIAVSDTFSEAEWWWRRHITEMEAKR